jgi:hypothetical protein
MSKVFQVTITSLLLASCAGSAEKLDYKDEEKMKIIREAASNDNTKQDQKIYIKLAESNLNVSGISLETAFTYNSGNLIYFADAEGKSKSLNVVTKVFGELTTHEDAADFTTIYDYPGIGYVGLSGPNASFGLTENDVILNQSWENNNATLMAIYPGFLSFYNASGINLMFEDNESIKNFRLDLIEKEENAKFGMCAAGCLVWKMLENKFIVGVPNSGITVWNEYEISVSGISFSSIRSLHLIVTYANNTINISSGSGLTNDNKIFQLEAFTPATLTLHKQSQQDLVDLYCKSCHVSSDDNLSKVWGHKDHAIASLTGQPGYSPMPPPDSYQGLNLSDEEKSTLIDYFLSLDDDTSEP